jgi:hypothetical protein
MYLRGVVPRAGDFTLIVSAGFTAFEFDPKLKYRLILQRRSV